MLKEVFASNIAKLVAACVCPVVGASAVALKVPPVRQALHKATAPKPERQARAKPRVRAPIRPDAAADKAAPETLPALQSAMMCPQPAPFDEAPMRPVVADGPMSMTPDLPARRGGWDYGPGNCSPVSMPGGGVMASFAAIPEPATWAQMVAGFALLGGVVRSGRRRAARFA
jgi:hypothetical protein